MNPLHITIRSTPDGCYRWELRDGPDGAFTYAGTAPLLERCFEDILRSQWVLAEHLTADLDPESVRPSHDTPHPTPVPQVHTPNRRTLPAQQDIPAPRHGKPSTFIYPHPTESG